MFSETTLSNIASKP